MITRRELRRYAAREKVSLGALEKDYILTMVLRQVYADETLKTLLVLKGGTALHKLYLHRRLSLDLDFTALRPVALDEVKGALEVAEIQGQVKDYQVFHDALTINQLGYLGPLGYPSSITVNVSFRERVILPPVTHVLENLYFEPFPVTAMELEEMVAEKLRAALMRKAPRDYFDLWLVLKEAALNASLVPELVMAKLETVGLKYDPAMLWGELDMLERLWEEDLRELMPRVPEFSILVRELREGLPALLGS